MLLAVEGGGFFSSSASGYSKGLTLLLLGQKRDDNKHMRVSPYNQYQLVDRETETDLQLASGKNRISRGCATFVCFGRTSAGVDGQLPLKVGPTQPQDIFPSDTTNERVKEHNSVGDDDSNVRSVILKSSLKKPSYNCSEIIKNSDEKEPLDEGGSDLSERTERRKVQWTDSCGKELTDIREFELSEHGESDDEFVNGNGKTCSCRIM